ncbi:hypothetical protein CGRA01v4_12480 [Colletotrichum graminicola]|nr:hypothetical protein CGRA01v4_12480 [Colletotrichum graminicola]
MLKYIFRWCSSTRLPLPPVKLFHDESRSIGYRPSWGNSIGCL